MEFDNVGAHCQHDECHQKDFLPFLCDHCGKSLCLLHRSYVSHNCSGDKNKDMTSMDCPICGKSVVFDKGQDANVVWDDHYVNSCTQQGNGLKKNIVRCFKPDCHTVLGPSNTYTCNKCHQRVCLAHRIPEEHRCVGHIRTEFLNKVQKQMTVGNAEKTKKNTHKKDPAHQPVSMFLPGGFHHHGKESASKPPPPPPAASATATITCPFCGLPQESDAGLIGHIMAFHPEDGASAVPPAPPSSSTAGTTAGMPPPPPTSSMSTTSTSGSTTATATTTSNAHTQGRGSALHREVCPLCQARFEDPIALVRHFESSHSERAQELFSGSSGGGNSGQSGGTTQKPTGGCTMA